jgi:SAM-dependent methyltransferase
MNEIGTTLPIRPKAYAAWRATSLGAIIDVLEQCVTFSLMGELRDAHVLDAGCGDGALACAATSRGAVMIGVDPDPAMVAAGRARAGREGIEAIFPEARLESLPFPDAEFDVVVAVTVLCFVADAAGAMREMARVLRSGGRLVVGELGRWSLGAAWRRVRGWFGSRTWAAARFRTASELRGLARQAGLTVAAVGGAVFYPPSSLLARAIAPIDPRLGRMTTCGAGFLAVQAVKVGDHARA